MQDEYGNRIAARAASHIGVPFRLHGRTCESGMDCIGLLADALRSVGCSLLIPVGYGLRGQFERQSIQFFHRACFCKLGRGEKQVAGDFCLVRVAPRQLHFIIFGSGGFVHAHAGLRRVVLTPGPVPWPIIAHWRYNGE